MLSECPSLIDDNADNQKHNNEGHGQEEVGHFTTPMFRIEKVPPWLTLESGERPILAKEEPMETKCPHCGAINPGTTVSRAKEGYRLVVCKECTAILGTINDPQILAELQKKLLDVEHDARRALKASRSK